MKIHTEDYTDVTLGDSGLVILREMMLDVLIAMLVMEVDKVAGMEVDIVQRLSLIHI